jgi:hypothetical protein
MAHVSFQQQHMCAQLTEADLDAKVDMVPEETHIYIFSQLVKSVDNPRYQRNMLIESSYSFQP